ncbi:MAG: LysM peptidoglycan-binding domain-containing protein [Treponema sp.]|nr:LysM peptidoglycan-binding domain-containing protein [Treponema sp.]
MKYLNRFILLFVMVCIFSSGALTAEQLIHIVGRGETVFSISRFYSVTEAELMRVNGITDPSRLQLGRRLVIPATAALALPSSGLGQTLVDYRVVRGDTLYSLARSHGITLQNLLEINRFNSSHLLRVGDVIKVPSAQATAQAPAPNTSTTQGQTPVASSNVTRVLSGIYAERWPVYPREITYMTGQMGVIVEGEQLEAVRSLTQGSVVSAGPWRKFGRVVIIETAGGYHYMYGGLETLSVNVGDRITPGMEVGRLGINSVSEKPHLYFMVFRSDTPIDPALAPRAGNAGSSRT